MTGLRDNEKVEIRRSLLQLLRNELVGPSGGPDETLRERPDKRYLMGTLFPRNATAAQVVQEEVTSAAGEAAAEVDGDGDEGIDSPTDLMFQRLPASVGISFATAVSGTVEMDVRVSGAAYEPAAGQDGPGRKSWRRRELGGEGGEVHSISISPEAPTRLAVLEGRASIHAIVRDGPTGSRIITLSLINEKELQEGGRFEPGDCLFQVGLEAVTPFSLRSWPAPERLFNDLEDEELTLQYRNKPVIAVGHGCAADWDLHGNKGASVRVEFFPTVEIAPITADIEGLGDEAKSSLSLQFIQSPGTEPGALIGACAGFVEEYARWRARLDGLQVPDGLSDARDRILDRIDRALARMRRGVRLLEEDPLARRCFQLANRAMLIQMVYSRRVSAAERGGAADTATIDVEAASFRDMRWRPFQLAFQLLALNGLWAADDPDRDIVDLIWFPTGGGKTEAYLAAAAFEMIRRRLIDGPTGAGTAVLMRYTLRLLTQQQFQRAGHLICALETLRKDDRDLGQEAFSLGLWVGNKVTPGSASEAYQVYDSKLRQEVGAVSNPFTVLRCPACGTPTVPPELKEQGAHECGIRATSSTFEFFCPTPDCDFHDLIPVQIVDDLLYAAPPTMIMGTLDKFAMTAWKDDAGRFFGRRRTGETRVEPPSLIIQDELHLISGPLGTIAGLYEAAIDVTIAAFGQRPKVIASTATTRRVSEQAKALYARDVDVFPPPGLDAGESFFSTVASNAGPGRLYVGAMAQGHTPTFSNVLASAALLSSVPRLKLDSKVEDGWWTLVAYHNSRRELGRSLTLARDDIPARIAALYQGTGQPLRTVANVEELSANIKGEDIPLVLERLGQPAWSGGSVDYLGCTNMLSVGVDVDRLGLMLVIGQPKTASEYIQATSRVGRDRGYLPGVVLSLYMPTKPRDRSHYEMFRPFHDAMYRYVEPSSVTPFALPARERAFHSALVSAVRMATSLNRNPSAAKFDRASQELRELLDSLYARMARADDTEELGISESARRIEDWWQAQASDGLRYSSSSGAKNYRPLLKRFGEPGHPDARETLQSMRHVDSSVRVKIVGRQDSTEQSKA